MQCGKSGDQISRSNQAIKSGDQNNQAIKSGDRACGKVFLHPEPDTFAHREENREVVHDVVPLQGDKDREAASN